MVSKNEEKWLAYRPLPHDSKRWRMIAGNVMLEMVTSYDNDNDTLRATMTDVNNH